ncbi:MAG: META domain-containing protein [Chloroflexi bacterium]|nr:META domain-containing protein [Chloroflexota bacterium]
MKLTRLAMMAVAAILLALGGAAFAQQDDTDSLLGTQWRLVSYGPPNDQMDILEDSAILLSFPLEDQMEGFAGCNSYSGSYTIDQDSITFGEIVATAAACTNTDVTQQEQTYLDSLGSVTRFERMGDSLTLWSGEDQQLRFVSANVNADILVGSQWRLVSYGDPDNQTEVVEDGEVTLTFATETRLGGEGGCNDYSANFRTSDGSISLTSIVHTELACDDEAIMQQEQAYFDALETATSYEGFFDRLFITYENGQQLRFLIVPNESAPESTETPTDAVTPTATATPAATPGTVGRCPETWLVKVGDTLSAIALTCGTTVDALLLANPEITDRALIIVDQVLVIPVGEGDGG